MLKIFDNQHASLCFTLHFIATNYTHTKTSHLQWPKPWVITPTILHTRIKIELRIQLNCALIASIRLSEQNFAFSALWRSLSGTDTVHLKLGRVARLSYQSTQKQTHNSSELCLFPTERQSSCALIFWTSANGVLATRFYFFWHCCYRETWFMWIILVLCRVDRTSTR